MSVPERGLFLETMQFHTVTVSFDTPGLLTGVVIWAPRVGDVILPLGYVSVTTAFDGTTPHLSLVKDGVVNDADQVGTGVNLAIANTPNDDAIYPVAVNWPGSALASVRTTNTPLLVRLSDGSDGDPESTQGQATAVLAVASTIG